MAGRSLHHSSAPSRSSRTQALIENHRLLSNRRQSSSSRAAIVEAQKREIQILLSDNQRLAASHIALKQELAEADQDLRQLSSTAVKIKAECDARVREVYDRSITTEEELQLIEGMRADFSQVNTDIENMTAESKDLAAKLREINDELAAAPSELAELPAVEEELHAMRQEVKRGRAAVEYEKKMQVTNLEQSQLMEENMDSLTREVEKLRVELTNAEKRAVAAAAAAAAAPPPPPPGTSYHSAYATHGGIHGGNFYSDPYKMQQVAHAGAINASLSYGPSGVPHLPNAPYVFQQPSAHNLIKKEMKFEHGPSEVPHLPNAPHDFQQPNAHNVMRELKSEHV